MKFRSSENPRRKVRASLDLTPLIDVVFQLLIFFMLSSTFVVQSSIQIEMPQAAGATNLEQKDVSVTLTAEPGGPEGGGLVYLDNDPVAEWADLTEQLGTIVTDQPDVTLMFRCDAAVPVERFVKAMGFARSVGIENFQIATEPLTEEE
jgi:biopolymer transport protein ExbD